MPHLNVNSTQAAHLEVLLQGVITAFPHDVTVVLNGTNAGRRDFHRPGQGTSERRFPPGLLQAGSNTVTLTAQNGDYDTSLVDHIRITYPHAYVADSDQLKFTGRAGDELSVSGFTGAPAVLDITDPNRPVQLTPQVTSSSGQYEIAVQVPFTTTNPAGPVRHTLLAVADDRVASAAGVWPNHPSHWHSVQAGADIAMVTYGEFAATLAPLVHAHQAEGKSSAVVPVNDLYDEFNFGERTPLAIRQFLQTATQNWKKAPTYLLLNGRASLDPRNYLGIGNLDLVPTRIVPSASLMTASDDWFSDFTDSGMPTIATGRLPVSTVSEATTVVGKIATYEGQSTNGPWTANALMVADKDDTESFTQDSQTVQAKLPATMQVTDIFVDTVGTTDGPRGHPQRDQLGAVAGELPWPRVRRAVVRIRHIRYQFGELPDQWIAASRLPDHGLSEWILPGCVCAAAGRYAAAGAERRRGRRAGLERAEPALAADQPRHTRRARRPESEGSDLGRCLGQS